MSDRILKQPIKMHVKTLIFQVAVALLLVVVGQEVVWGQKSYDGYVALKLNPQTQDQVDKLRKLMLEGSDEHVRFWNEPHAINGTVDVMVSSSEKSKLQAKLKSWNVPNHEFLSDIGAAIQRTIAPISSQRYTSGPNHTRSTAGDRFYTQFQSYAAIEARLAQLAKSPKVTLETVGKSFEGRNIHLVKISNDPGANKPVIFIDALHHAREWASLSTVMYLIESLGNEQFQTRLGRHTRRHRHGRQGSSHSHSHSHSHPHSRSHNNSHAHSHSRSHLRAAVSSALDSFDFWFVPCVNPDGYEYSRTQDRMWRKTRSGSGYCRGVDPNRNYPVHWNEVGTSNRPCADIYAGPKALSEVESQTIARIMDQHAKRITMYLSLHAYSQVILCPYGHAKVYPDNYAELQRVAEVGMEALASVRGTKYKFGTSAILMYPAAGGSDDYAHGVARIRYSYTMELPDTGRTYGFLLPPDQIIPVGEETTVAIAAMTRAIHATTRRSRG